MTGDTFLFSATAEPKDSHGALIVSDWYLSADEAVADVKRQAEGLEDETRPVYEVKLYMQHIWKR